MTRDTAAIQSKLDAAALGLGAGWGASVILPAGVFDVSGLRVPEGVTLAGAGPRHTRLAADAPGPVVTVSSWSRVRDLHVYGSPGSVGIVTDTAAHHWRLADCFVSGHREGIHVEDSYINAMDRVTIQACETGLALAGANVNALTITGGEVQGCTTGIHATTGTSTKVTLSGVTIEGNTGHGFLNDGYPYGWSLRDCYFEANQAGHVKSRQLTRALVVDGCTFTGRAAFSIDLDTGLDTSISGCLFNLTAPCPSITCAAPVRRTTIGRCWYKPGQEFDPAQHYHGSKLVMLDRAA